MKIKNKIVVDLDVITVGIWKKIDKREDIMLILACVSAKADYLVTLNKRHLKNNVNSINTILDKNKLNKIKVVHPNEI